MPRTSRIVIPGYLYHIVQRGNNRQYIFKGENDYILYLKRIEEYREKFKLDIFAYCLLGNHVHFILRPQQSGALACMFRSVNMRYAQYYQKKTRSSGHVWQGRFYSCLLSGEHVSAAIRYVEINPVRAKIAEKAWQYPWSSARAHMGKRYQWIKLADINEFVKVESWKNYLLGTEDEKFVKNLREMTKKNLALGPNDFILQLEGILRRKFMPGPKGRPRNERK